MRAFGSYARKDDRLAHKLSEELKLRLSCKKGTACDLWRDVDIQPGQDWDKTIEAQLKDCEVGILYLSPAFFASGYITAVELTAFLKKHKTLIPVALRPINFGSTEMHGVEKRQAFFLNKPSFDHPKAYSECDANQKEAFVNELFAKIVGIIG